MQVYSKSSVMHLESLPVDIGYASDKVTLSTSEGKEIVIGGQNGLTQLIMSAPHVDDELIHELELLDKALPTKGDNGVEIFFVLSKGTKEIPEVGRIQFLIDTQEEYADFYSTRLVGAPYDGMLTKALIVISKDGALFYDEFLEDLDKPFNKETLERKILAAQLCYTGKGCH